MAAKLKPRQIWESGQPLQAAWLFYASVTDGQAFSSGLQIPKPREDVRPGDLTEGLLLGLAGLSEIWKAQKEHRERKAQLMEDLRDDLLDRLYEGNLVSFGFRRSISKLSRTPSQLSAKFFFDADVTPANSSI